MKKTTEQNYEEKYFITGQELALNIIIKQGKISSVNTVRTLSWETLKQEELSISADSSRSPMTY